MKQIAFIGAAGIPNRYGGFESFLEHCGPAFVDLGCEVIVTCDAKLYHDHCGNYNGIKRIFINLPANGALSILHDLFAFFRVLKNSDRIIVLGVSGALWFPIFRMICNISRKRLVVNIDGLEWRRQKHSYIKRKTLKFFDYIAQIFAHHIVYDNQGLYGYLTETAKIKSTCIPYSGDHVLRDDSERTIAGTALTICRVEPENNLEILIEAVLKSHIHQYTIIGNWNNSRYARDLRQKYADCERLYLKDPIYDQEVISKYRQSCEYYLHGHSVGGTNPSLVEMLFYDCHIFAFDVSFNRYTAEDGALYFKTSDDLHRLFIEAELTARYRTSLRHRYSAKEIAAAYIGTMDFT